MEGAAIISLKDRFLSKFQRIHIAFVAVFLLFAVGALVKVDCPVCNGCGSFSNTIYMENVRIIGSESEEKFVTRSSVCEIFVVYKYDVTLQLLNEGPNTAVGWLKMVLVYSPNKKVVDTQFAPVEIPGQTLLNPKYTVWFNTHFDEEMPTEVYVEVPTGKVVDTTCNGTGRLPLNSWFLVKSLKESFQRTVILRQGPEK